VPAVRNLIREGRFFESLGGPVAAGSVLAQTAAIGLYEFLHVAAFLSVMIGIFNLLPVPALDGGRLAFLLVERLRGRTIDPRQEGLIHTRGLRLLLLIVGPRSGTSWLLGLHGDNAPRDITRAARARYGRRAGDRRRRARFRQSMTVPRRDVAMLAQTINSRPRVRDRPRGPRRRGDALAAIKPRSPLPIVADIRLDHRLALRALDAGIDKLRINPHIGSRERTRSSHVRRARGVPIVSAPTWTAQRRRCASSNPVRRLSRAPR
jgi:hypothetical protein